jgi:hypothetical protein
MSTVEKCRDEIKRAAGFRYQYQSRDGKTVYAVTKAAAIKALRYEQRSEEIAHDSNQEAYREECQKEDAKRLSDEEKYDWAVDLHIDPKDRAGDPAFI